MNTFKKLIFSCLGLGYLPYCPGSFGTLGGVAVWVMTPRTGLWQSAVLVLVVILAFFSIGYAQRLFQAPDPQRVVIDEVLGFLIAAWCVPVSLKTGIALYVLFRFFDIVKIPPARSLESISGVWGVVLDDVCAGLYTRLIFQVVIVRIL